MWFKLTLTCSISSLHYLLESATNVTGMVVLWYLSVARCNLSRKCNGALACWWHLTQREWGVIKHTHSQYTLIIILMTQEVLISLLNQANTGNELLAILDSLINQEGEESAPFAWHPTFHILLQMVTLTVWKSLIPSLIALCSIIIANTITTWEKQWQQSGDSILSRNNYTLPQSIQRHQESKLISHWLHLTLECFHQKNVI